MKLAIDERRCKGCNLCTQVCPYHLFRPGTTANRKGVLVPDSTGPSGARTAGSGTSTAGPSAGSAR